MLYPLVLRVGKYNMGKIKEVQKMEKIREARKGYWENKVDLVIE